MTLDLTAAVAAWEALDAACSGLLAQQCKRHAPYMGCPMDCNDVENALVPEHATAAAIIPAALARIATLEALLMEACDCASYLLKVCAKASIEQPDEYEHIEEIKQKAGLP